MHLVIKRNLPKKKYKKSPPTTTFSNREALVGRGGFEPPKSWTTDLQSVPFGRSGISPYIYKKMELVNGIEPSTY